MGLTINIIERKNRIQITIVILMIVVISMWISYNTDVEEYRHHIFKKASRGQTFVKTINLLRTNFELYTEPPHKSETSTYGILTATAYSSTDLSAGIINQNNTTPNQSEFSLRLQLIRMEITYLFKKGKISDSYYNILQNKISEYIVKVNS